LNTGSLPVMGLFTSDHMSYEMDRDSSKEPSLKEMAMKAIEILQHATRGSNQGFFLMIEGSRIDMAAHSNDPAAHVHEILAYQETVAAVKDYVARNSRDTVMVSVSDHETGGFTLGRQLNASYPDYEWYPKVIQRIHNSTHVAAAAILEHKAVNSSDLERFVRSSVLDDGFGITDCTSVEMHTLLEEANDGDAMEIMNTLGDMASRRALLGWTTHGHTGVDVNLYAFGVNSERLRGNRENTEIGEFLRDMIGVRVFDEARVLGALELSKASVNGTDSSTRVKEMLLDRFTMHNHSRSH